MSRPAVVEFHHEKVLFELDTYCLIAWISRVSTLSELLEKYAKCIFTIDDIENYSVFIEYKIHIYKIYLQKIPINT